MMKDEGLMMFTWQFAGNFRLVTSSTKTRLKSVHMSVLSVWEGSFLSQSSPTDDAGVL